MVIYKKHKARLVAKGYSQQPGVDYTETFAPVARLDTIQALVALAAQRMWKIYQLDVKSAFLNGFLEEEIYVEQPQGFIKKGKEDQVLKLKKALYGLKQAPHACNKTRHRVRNQFVIKKQETVAQSSAEAKYVAAANSANQAKWLRRILEDMGEKQDETTQILRDNKSAIAMAKNHVFHGRTKHIDIKYHFLREVTAKKEIELKYCKTEEQIADIFTKALPRPKFEFLRNMLGVTSKNIKEEC
ncbi:uncharacterized protein [Rutidosis leptorrhynchoides]|uniref:uncharacterized protein n=1 Tax=Rutidosis leptorrhynchoides TaxID=125765 RepID=UPI003A995083